MEKNEPEVWDKIWDTMKEEYEPYILKKEQCSKRWEIMEGMVVSNFGKFEGLRVIEVGGGLGCYSALFAMNGAEVTVLDYSESALKRSEEFFNRNALKADFILQDALKIEDSLKGKFDVSMSFGLAEHFKGDDRKKIIKSHLDLVRDGGLTFISVPNKYNPPYRIYKYLAQATGRWHCGEEYPFSRGELFKICGMLGVEDFGFFGESFYSSFHFINPMKIVRRILRLPPQAYSAEKVKKERGTILDPYFSYALVLYAKKEAR